MEEIWKHITGYEDYMISNLGRVKSLKNGKEKILRPGIQSSGYLCVTLYKNTKKKHYLVHRLVGETFLENPDNLPCINHKDEVKTNNSVDNLEFCSYQYNLTYADKHLKYARKVGYYKDGKLIKVYDAIQDVKKDGFNQSNVCSALKGRYKSSAGFQWKYLN